MIEGRRPLNGTVTPGGNKNEALPALAATLLTEEPVVLDNVMRINSVEEKVKRTLDTLRVTIDHGHS